MSKRLDKTVHNEFKNISTDSEVKCAFREEICSPNCAACHMRGLKCICVRSGVDNEFEIGYLES